MHAGFMAFSGLDPEVGFLKRSERYFTVTDACIGCGACTDVCPRGNYELTSHGVATQGDCDFCFACIQNCPAEGHPVPPGQRRPIAGTGRTKPGCPIPERACLADGYKAGKQPIDDMIITKIQ